MIKINYLGKYFASAAFVAGLLVSSSLLAMEEPHKSSSSAITAKSSAKENFNLSVDEVLEKMRQSTNPKTSSINEFQEKIIRKAYELANDPKHFVSILWRNIDCINRLSAYHYSGAKVIFGLRKQSIDPEFHTAEQLVNRVTSSEITNGEKMNEEREEAFRNAYSIREDSINGALSALKNLMDSKKILKRHYYAAEKELRGGVYFEPEKQTSTTSLSKKSTGKKYSRHSKSDLYRKLGWERNEKNGVWYDKFDFDDPYNEYDLPDDAHCETWYDKW